MKPNRQIYNMIFEEDDLKWQSLIYEMIRTGKVDPWDIDVSVFAQEYLKMIKKLKQLNFRISGKVVLAAAILLRMKTDRLGLQQFLGLIEEQEDELQEEAPDELNESQTEMEQRIEQVAQQINKHKKIALSPRLDRKRERKVTVFELMAALKKAMEVDARRVQRKKQVEDKFKQPEYDFKKFDILGKIKKVYEALILFFKKYKKNTVEFSQIIPSKEKRDIIWTFVPLLHLANEGKIELHQDKPFSKIYIQLKEKLGAAND